MEQLEVPGGRLAYVVRGAGRPVVLICGAGRHEVWDRGGALTALAAAHRVVAYDRRGWGASSAPATPDYARHAEDAASLVRAVVGGPATVVGWSGGGNVALRLAVRHPDLVGALVLVEPPFHAVRHATGAFVGTFARIKAAQLRGQRRAAAEEFYRFVMRRRDGGDGWAAVPEPDRDRLLLAPRDTEALLTELGLHRHGALAEDVPTGRLRGIRAPITYLLGRDSNALMHRLHARYAGGEPGVRSVRVPGAAHMVLWDAPGAVVGAVAAAAAPRR
jgi:pimeloyl-ACP methyl ester carboxylesterase